jgi:hypothetical protein
MIGNWPLGNTSVCIELQEGIMVMSMPARRTEYFATILGKLRGFRVILDGEVMAASTSDSAGD